MSLQAQPPLPAPPVLTPPLGWLGALGMKSGGSQPGQVAGFLQPSFDMDRFYRAGARSLLGTVTNLPATFNNSVTLFTVPAGKVWLVDAVNLTAGTFGVAAGVLINILAAGPGGNVYAQTQSNLRYLTGELAILTLPGPLICGPGDVISAFQTATAAPTAFNFNATVAGFQVSA